HSSGSWRSPCQVSPADGNGSTPGAQPNIGSKPGTLRLAYGVLPSYERDLQKVGSNLCLPHRHTHPCKLGQLATGWSGELQAPSGPHFPDTGLERMPESPSTPVGGIVTII